MQLFLDSADLTEIKEVMSWDLADGLTTTPTFMHRSGVEDVDSLIIQLAGIVPQLQIEALGNDVESIRSEAYRQLDLGLDAGSTVFKIPMSLHGVQACKQLVSDGLMVNMHLVYTVQQAYMAMQAGATYVCPLVGRLQDQGQDALGLVSQIVEMKERYLYDSNVMFSSVRHTEHVRNAIDIGVDACTIPYKVLKSLTENHFTSLGAQQFEKHTRLTTKQVSDVMRKARTTVERDSTVADALIYMSTAGYGAVTVVDDTGMPVRIFTDGDLRRLLSEQGNKGLEINFNSLSAFRPKTISLNDSLLKAHEQFVEHKVDTLVVLENGKAVGLLDIQDII